MYRIDLNRGVPVRRSLSGPLTGITVTLRRLRANEFAEAQSAALAILRDRSKLVELLEEYDLRPPRRKLKSLLEDAGFMMGIGQWLAAVECGERAISEWSGLIDENGQALPLGRRSLEAAFLSQAFLDQVLPLIDAAANLLVLEGNVSGLSPSGSPEPAKTASALNTATTAAGAASPAHKASRAGAGSSAPKSKTRRSRAKAPPSGG